MNIWRIHLKAAFQAGIDQRQLCLDKGIVGVGWQVQYESESLSWEEYLGKAKSVYGDKSWWTALNALKKRMKKDDLIWTRDWYGNYYLGCIVSDWYYDTSKDCSKADIVNVRKCDWHYVGTEEAVPGKVVSSFRPARAVQRINDSTVYSFSQFIYNQISKSNYYQVGTPGNDIFSLISADDCEDALALYLQTNYDYFVIPSSCKKDTMTYEYELKDRKTGKSAAVQVKSGETSLNTENFKSDKIDIFLFATNGQYNGSPKPNIHTIDPEEIRRFLYTHTYLLPAKMKVWVELTR